MQETLTITPDDLAALLDLNLPAPPWVPGVHKPL